MNALNSLPTARLGALLAQLLLVLGVAFALSACSGDDVSGGQISCSTDTDCPLGRVCGASGLCVEAACEFCTEDQICYRTPENPAGSCSAPECSIAEDCDWENGFLCVQGVCTDGANVNQNQTNNNQNNNQTEPECTEQSECGPGEVCVQPAGVCNFDCNLSGEPCPAGTFCTSTGSCEQSQCPDLDPSDCTGATPHFNAQNCSCDECTSSAHCGAGQSCSGGVCQTQTACPQTCSSSSPGDCAGTGFPYCIDDCCVECLGAADCSGGQLCLDGFCGTPPDCSVDPTVCPAGYNCTNGNCVAPTGVACSDPDDCPSGQFCDLASGQCQALGGGDCGFCNPDCTCDGGMECLGFVCAGCEVTLGLDGLSDNCPQGQTCDVFLAILGLPICLPD